MQAVQRSGVELDICPQCRGVWLDRGELEKIIEQGSTRPAEDFQRNERHDRPDHGRSPWGQYDHDRHDRHDHDRHDHHDRDHPGHGRKRPSIFDIFD